MKKRQSDFVAKLAGLKPGVHIHIHEKSDCSATADGSSTGGHWNQPLKHGKWGVANIIKEI
jgi:Cu-Zn family superoxide dismutase